MVNFYEKGASVSPFKKGQAEHNNSLCFLALLLSAIENLPLLAAGKFAGIFVEPFARTAQS
jgi:hypothetical protein